MSDIGVYVHWPYCAHICPYCDFNVYRARNLDKEPLLAAIEGDIAAQAQRFGRREAVSIFLGGGTPSLLSGGDVERIIGAVDRAFGLAAACEITLEANPEDAALFADHAAAGVNRFSIGAQAFDDAALKALGRWHDGAQARRAVDAAIATEKRVSIDLIYAREGQAVGDWRNELRGALAMPAEHLSLYQLTIEPDTAFARRAGRGDLTPPDSELAATFYEVTQEVCNAAGMPAYEISNHARTAAARSRHNLLYWRSEDWIGVGPGAHGRVAYAGARLATEAHRRPADYVDAVATTGAGLVGETRLSGEEAADEALIMGLRVVEGVEKDQIEALRGAPLSAAALSSLQAQGFLVLEGRRIRLTDRGWLLANKIVAELSA